MSDSFRKVVEGLTGKGKVDTGGAIMLTVVVPLLFTGLITCLIMVVALILASSPWLAFLVASIPAVIFYYRLGALLLKEYCRQAVRDYVMSEEDECDDTR